MEMMKRKKYGQSDGGMLRDGKTERWAHGKAFFKQWLCAAERNGERRWEREKERAEKKVFQFSWYKSFLHKIFVWAAEHNIAISHFLLLVLSYPHNAYWHVYKRDILHIKHTQRERETDKKVNFDYTHAHADTYSYHIKSIFFIFLSVNFRFVGVSLLLPSKLFKFRVQNDSKVKAATFILLCYLNSHKYNK